MKRLLPVRRPYERVRMDVQNQSSRAIGGPPTLIVLHDTESVNIPHSDMDLRSIGSWFDNPVAQASSHVCVDGEGRSARYVPDHRKAWHCAGYNSASLGIEQVGRATQTAWPDAQLRKTAKYIAHWSHKYAIQLDHTGVVGNGIVTIPGVVTHSMLGSIGGSHHDPGPHYPLNDVLHMARFYRRRGWIV